MDNNGDILAVFFEKRADLILIPDIDIFVAIVGDRLQQKFAVPSHTRRVAEEWFPHVVVDPDDIETVRRE